eukprot:6182327-Pleurochrysis_carterae.AAC.2
MCLAPVEACTMSCVVLHIYHVQHRHRSWDWRSLRCPHARWPSRWSRMLSSHGLCIIFASNRGWFAVVAFDDLFNRVGAYTNEKSGTIKLTVTMNASSLSRSLSPPASAAQNVATVIDRTKVSSDVALVPAAAISAFYLAAFSFVVASAWQRLTPVLLPLLSSPPSPRFRPFAPMPFSANCDAAVQKQDRNPGCKATELAR